MDESLHTILIQKINKFTPVNSDNFLDWLWNLKIALSFDDDIWYTIFVRDPKDHRRPTAPKEDEPGYAEYRRLSAKACAWIRMASGSHNARITEHFNAEKDVVGMYDALVEKYVPSTLAAATGAISA